MKIWSLTNGECVHPVGVGWGYSLIKAMCGQSRYKFALKMGVNLRLRSDNGYRFWRLDLKIASGNYIFWPENGKGFRKRSHPPLPSPPVERAWGLCVPLLFSQAFTSDVQNNMFFVLWNFQCITSPTRGIYVQVCSLRRKLLDLRIIAILTELQCEAKNMFSLLHRRSNRVFQKSNPFIHIMENHFG